MNGLCVCTQSDAAVGEKYKAEIFDLTNFYMVSLCRGVPLETCAALVHLLRLIAPLPVLICQEAKDALEDAHESWETTYFGALGPSRLRSIES